MFKILYSALTALALLGVAAASPTSTIEARNTGPPGFNITTMSIIGSGCPPGSAFYTLRRDGSAVTISFGTYYAQAGPGFPISDNRKNCQMALGVQVPTGFTFGISSVEYHNFYQLDRRVTMAQKAVYYFQGQPQQATARSAIRGPLRGADYTFRDPFDLASTVLSPCGSNSTVFINSELRVNNAENPQGSGFISADSSDISFHQVYNFEWQRC